MERVETNKIKTNFSTTRSARSVVGDRAKLRLRLGFEIQLCTLQGEMWSGSLCELCSVLC